MLAHGWTATVGGTTHRCRANGGALGEAAAPQLGSAGVLLISSFALPSGNSLRRATRRRLTVAGWRFSMPLLYIREPSAAPADIC